MYLYADAPANQNGLSIGDFFDKPHVAVRAVNGTGVQKPRATPRAFFATHKILMNSLLASNPPQRIVAGIDGILDGSEFSRARCVRCLHFSALGAVALDSRRKASAEQIETGKAAHAGDAVETRSRLTAAARITNRSAALRQR
jgi:hypothetical protein